MPANVTCVWFPARGKVRCEREPTPRGCRAPPAEPMVRAESLQTFGSSLPKSDRLRLRWYRELGQTASAIFFGCPVFPLNGGGIRSVRTGIAVEQPRSARSVRPPAPAAPFACRTPRRARDVDDLVGKMKRTSTTMRDHGWYLRTIVPKTTVGSPNMRMGQRPYRRSIIAPLGLNEGRRQLLIISSCSGS